MRAVEDLVRHELEGQPRPSLSPFFARRTANLARSRREPGAFARLLVPLLVVPPSLWILTASLPPFWILVVMPFVFVLTMAANPTRET